MIGFTHIQLTETQRQRVTYPAKPKMGTAAVLAQLLPRLTVNTPSERYQALTDLDYYMREETERLLARIETHLEILVERIEGMANHSQPAQFSLTVSNGICELKGEFPFGLDEKLNQDPWLMDAFAWLIPNYLALVHSLELRAFSYAYQRCRAKAVVAYQHLDEPNHGLAVVVMFSAGKARWQVNTPQTIYHL
ncbi:hypothetical protein FX988_01940 [Paraglaciecola mesophila]|uniref:Uncharacterized protein n=1 Tax=Paraglaciecola mesophila TaxID=197222 RepID=A0A857JI62_9ALTE|nr:hypothetical protein [Paraglaciecola mesophila]QHJ11705.1 hypothetical protein FX988_01940 [Paraglaciecola mesophila]